MDWQVEYYKKESGKIPVLEYLLTLNPKMRAKAFSEIELLEKHGTDLREPYTKPIKGERYKDLYELCGGDKYDFKGFNVSFKKW